MKKKKKIYLTNNKNNNNKKNIERILNKTAEQTVKASKLLTNQRYINIFEYIISVMQLFANISSALCNCLRIYHQRYAIVFIRLDKPHQPAMNDGRGGVMGVVVGGSNGG